MKDPQGYFSRTIDAADQAFLSACARVGSDPIRFLNPQKGPAGEELATTVTSLGPQDAELQLVVVSGTHGAEGHTGSAIQCAALDALRDMVLPAGVRVTFIHLINPWGCAWDRKENEDNVDLHRAFTYPTGPWPEAPDYDAVSDFLNIPQWEGPLRAEADARLAAWIAEHGFDAIAAIAVTGSHHHPKGLRFNGNGPTWSSRTLATITNAFLGAARRMIVLDIHTGFGPTGLGQMMTYAAPDTLESKRLHRWFPRVQRVGGGQSRLAVHPCMPYHRLADTLTDVDICVAALEFGTDNTARIDLDLVREESFIHLRGDPFSPEGRMLRARMRKRFYWEYPDWKATVLEQGLDAFRSSLRALKQDGQEDSLWNQSKRTAK